MMGTGYRLRYAASRLVALVLPLLVISPCAAFGQDCMDYRGLPHVVASTNVSGAWDLSLDATGTLAYAACGNGGFQVADISDPLAPSRLVYVITDDFATCVENSNGHAYVGDRAAGLQIYDVADPAAPAHLLTVPLSDYCFGLAVEGSYAYATDYTQFNVVDISDPVTATVVGSLPLAGYSREVVAGGGYAYVAGAGEGLQVLDVSVPAAPSLLTTLPLAGSLVDVAIVGSTVYAVSAEEGLHIVDVSVPGVPVLLGTVDTVDGFDRVESLRVADDYAYLTTNKGLQIVDVSSATSPLLVCKVMAGDDGADGLAVQGDYVYLGTSYPGLVVVDIHNPEATARTATFTTAGFTASDMVIRGSLGYICHGGGLQIVDLTDPDAPSTVGGVATFDSAVEVEFYGDYVVVCDLSNALHIIDVSDPANPVITGTLPLTEIPLGLAIAEAEGYAYLSLNWLGLMIVDISDPAAPVEVNTLYDLWMPGDIVVDYPRVYVADGQYGLQIFDMSDPYNPGVLGDADGEGYPGGLAVDLAGGYAYLPGNKGLAVIDVSDPFAPFWVMDLPLSGSPEEILLDLDDDLAYIAASTGGLHVVDISQRDAPVHLGSTYTEDEARGPGPLGPAGLYVLPLRRDRHLPLALRDGQRGAGRDAGGPWPAERVSQSLQPPHDPDLQPRARRARGTERLRSARAGVYAACSAVRCLPAGIRWNGTAWTPPARPPPRASTSPACERPLTTAPGK